VRTPDVTVLEELAEIGLITFDEGRVRTTRRWQSAMMRAISRHLRQGDDSSDIRYVIADALIEIRGDAPDGTESALCAAVEAMTYVELQLLPQQARSGDP
jgi:hypothetical protein